MGNMGPFGNMIHQEENEYMYIIHAQMILESKCILTEISITPSLSSTIYKVETYLKDLYEGISKSFEPNMERARNLDLFCFIFQRSPLPTPHTCPI